MKIRGKATRLAALLLSAAMLCALSVLPARAAGPVWDGKTIDVSWYNKTDKALYISTPAQLAGLAAIVNGIYNREIVNVIGDKSVIADTSVTDGDDGPSGQNKSTETYHYGADDFNGRTVCLTADLDMGGVYDTGTAAWSGPRFMPIGGQYLMEKNDSATKLSSSFCGVLDGQGHTVYNIYADRHCSNGNYGDGQSVGLVGRLGVHDNDPKEIRPVNPAVRNIAVTGYIYANRSVGGIVGKIGKTSLNNGDGSTGGIIENCANFATVANTDAKGCGGIVGAGWNGGVVRNCYNAGAVSTTYVCPTGGISGSNEIKLENCYSVGKISAVRDNYAMGIGTNNGGAPFKSAVLNCWYLDGSAPGGGYYSSGVSNNDGALTSEKMTSADFAKTLGEAFAPDLGGVNGGYPVLAWQKSVTRPLFSAYADVSVTAWYFEAVSYVMSKGLFDTSGGGAFAPEQPMTRAMLATALYRLAGAPETAPAGVFTDVDKNAAYAGAVGWAYDNGIVTGVGGTRFDPDGGITREQIAAMLYRYAAYEKVDTTASGDLNVFPDAAQISDFAKTPLAWAVGLKLINGTGAGTADPQGAATRAQVAQILFNYAS
ncbi:S-layer homology domain-containing protein [Sporobacter termitidis DSM 10068]|uniref:S-layer homology domain-containing protein n=1 Tax=Sporobacter termitidis DSM 10068 TaxID=1123282 RepID=A0A1M5XDI6_9FIRM|nr:S-layer homology domain-containing protein [Sporobacter termitidis]SHH97935.1 S-layer homology domain-containing protein [Sporobacter termitidis DSM 10068]